MLVTPAVKIKGDNITSLRLTYTRSVYDGVHSDDCCGYIESMRGEIANSQPVKWYGRLGVLNLYFHGLWKKVLQRGRKGPSLYRWASL